MDIKASIKHINLLVSNRCNLKCKMCDYHMEASARQELSLDDITCLIAEAAALGLERIELSGGEPMLRKDIYQIIEFAKSLNIRSLLVTNGTLIGEIEAEKLVSSGISAVIISLEGPEDINDFIRGKGSFRKALNAIISLKKYRENLDYINVGITVSKVNSKHLYEFTRYLIEEAGVDSISYNPFDREMLWEENYAGVKDIFTITPDLNKDLKHELQKIIDYGKDKKINLSPDYFLHKFCDYFDGKSIKPVFPCCEPITGCAIKASGEVFACWGQQNIPVGNIATSSFKTIIESEKYIDACKNGLTLKCGGCLKACYVSIHSNTF